MAGFKVITEGRNGGRKEFRFESFKEEASLARICWNTESLCFLRSFASGETRPEGRVERRIANRAQMTKPAAARYGLAGYVRRVAVGFCDTLQERAGRGTD